jgi:arsenite methyltransferase
MDSTKGEIIREAVRHRYAQVAARGACGCAPSCCANSDTVEPAATASRALGYSPDELAAVPKGADLGLGCGNPQAIASLAPGEVVLDLGAGAGFDCFLAARAVGPTGHVIGVDMTPEMIARARANAVKGGYANVEFRLGEIEHLPLADASVDAIISNCVINLVPDKARAFAEARRVLKPGGRLAIADVVARTPLPASVREDLALHAGCVSGAAAVGEIEAMLRAAGFEHIRIAAKDESRSFIGEWSPDHHALADLVVAATIEAVKPAG